MIDGKDICNSIMSTSWMQFDPNTYNWKRDSYKLATEHSDFFDIWWNKKLFNYTQIEYLIILCPDKFFKWWDPYKVKTSLANIKLLAKYCPKFINTWWVDRAPSYDIPWGDLIENCSSNFEIWWNSNEFPWGWYSDELKEFCDDHKHIWGTDYLMWKLEQDPDIVAVKAKSSCAGPTRRRRSTWPTP